MAVSPNRQVSCLLAFLLQLLVLQLPTLDSAPFHVTAPQEPVLALVGSDVELTCLFSTNESAEHVEELRWFRQTRSPAVLLYRAGQEQEDQQMTEYRGRATLVTDGLPDGRATLLIRGVRVSDQGEYRCSFKDNDNSEEASAHLKVAGGYTEGCVAKSFGAGFILQITLRLKKGGRRRLGDKWEEAQLRSQGAERDGAPEDTSF